MISLKKIKLTITQTDHEIEWKATQSTKKRVNVVTFVMSIPVISSMALGSLTTISSNSPVSFEAPTAPSPLDTIVTFLHAAKGAAISAAT